MRPHAGYVEGDSRTDIVKQDGGRAYRDCALGEMIRYLGDKDVTPRRMMEDILAMEEARADAFFRPAHSRCW